MLPATLNAANLPAQKAPKWPTPLSALPSGLPSTMKNMLSLWRTWNSALIERWHFLCALYSYWVKKLIILIAIPTFLFIGQIGNWMHLFLPPQDLLENKDVGLLVSFFSIACNKYSHLLFLCISLLVSIILSFLLFNFHVKCCKTVKFLHLM